MAKTAAFSPACERNRAPILDELQSIIRPDDQFLLEIGSGTGQHAAYMAPSLTGITWYPTDTADKLFDIEQWRKKADCNRIQAARTFQVGQNGWPLSSVQADIIFTANTFHIMPADLVAKLIHQAGENMRDAARFVVYGPF
ncbi:MAG: DUF938 domain-containing protein, partial [Proteobacteria bacterium]